MSEARDHYELYRTCNEIIAMQGDDTGHVSIHPNDSPAVPVEATGSWFVFDQLKVTSLHHTETEPPAILAGVHLTDQGNPVIASTGAHHRSPGMFNLFLQVEAPPVIVPGDIQDIRAVHPNTLRNLSVLLTNPNCQGISDAIRTHFGLA